MSSPGEDFLEAVAHVGGYTRRGKGGKTIRVRAHSRRVDDSTHVDRALLGPAEISLAVGDPNRKSGRTIGDLANPPTRADREAAEKAAEKAKVAERKRRERNEAAKRRRAEKKRAAAPAKPKPPPSPPRAPKRVPKPPTGAPVKSQPVAKVALGSLVRFTGQGFAGESAVLVGRSGGTRTPRVHLHVPRAGRVVILPAGSVTHTKQRTQAQRLSGLLAARQAALADDPDSAEVRRIEAALTALRGVKPAPPGEVDDEDPFAPPDSAWVDPAPHPSGLIVGTGDSRAELLTTHPNPAADPRKLRAGDGVLYGPDPSSLFGGRPATVLGISAAGILTAFDDVARKTVTIPPSAVHHVFHDERPAREQTIKSLPAAARKRGRATLAAEPASVERLVTAPKAGNRHGYGSNDDPPTGVVGWFRSPTWRGHPRNNGGRVTRWPTAPGDRAPGVGESPSEYDEKNWVRGGSPGEVERARPDGTLKSTMTKAAVLQSIDALYDKTKTPTMADRRTVLDRISDAAPDHVLATMTKADLIDLWNAAGRYKAYAELQDAIDEVLRRRGVKFTEAGLALGRALHHLLEDEAFEQLHPRAPTGQFATKDEERKGEPQRARAAATKKRKPSLANIKGREMEWGQRLAVAHLNDDLGTIARFKALTGIRKKADRIRWAVAAVAPKFLSLGTNLVVDDRNDVAVQAALLNLSLVPSPVFAALKSADVRVSISRRSLGSYPEFAANKGTHDGRSWDETGAAYVLDTRHVVVNAALYRDDPRAVLHEVAHAFDLTATRMSEAPAFDALWRKHAPSWGDGYYWDPAMPMESRREFAAESLSRSWARLYDFLPEEVQTYYERLGITPKRSRPRRPRRGYALQEARAPIAGAPIALSAPEYDFGPPAGLGAGTEQGATARQLSDQVGEVPSQFEWWAERELRRAGLFDKDSDYDGLIGPAVMKLVRALAGDGHSGFSAAYVTALFRRLADRQPLTELTSDPAEWNHVGEDVWGEAGGIWQSARNPSAFSNDGGRTYYLLADREETYVEDGVSWSRGAPKEKWPPLRVSAPANTHSLGEAFLEAAGVASVASYVQRRGGQTVRVRRHRRHVPRAASVTSPRLSVGAAMSRTAAARRRRTPTRKQEPPADAGPVANAPQRYASVMIDAVYKAAWPKRMAIYDEFDRNLSDVEFKMLDRADLVDLRNSAWEDNHALWERLDRVLDGDDDSDAAHEAKIEGLRQALRVAGLGVGDDELRSASDADLAELHPRSLRAAAKRVRPLDRELANRLDRAAGAEPPPPIPATKMTVGEAPEALDRLHGEAIDPQEAIAILERFDLQSDAFIRRMDRPDVVDLVNAAMEYDQPAMFKRWDALLDKMPRDGIPPRLDKLLGGNLVVHDFHHPIINSRLDDLGLLPDGVLKALRENHVRISLATEGLDDFLDDNPGLASFSPEMRRHILGVMIPDGFVARGAASASTPGTDYLTGSHVVVPWPNDHWIAGLPARSVEAGASTTLHEVGHALSRIGYFGDHGESLTRETAHAAKLQGHREARPHHVRLAAAFRLRDHILQGGAGSTNGVEELIAEGFAWVVKRGYRETAEHYDDEFADWMYAKVRQMGVKANMIEAMREAAEDAPITDDRLWTIVLPDGTIVDGWGERPTGITEKSS